MPKSQKRFQKRGRPVRSPIERARTLVWARAVCVAAKAPPHTLEGILGKNGRWIGLWSRYDKGLVSPSPERLGRIDRKLPGTRRYYDSPLWGLVENRDFTRSELHEYVLWLDKPFRGAFIDPAHGSEGQFWRCTYNPYDLLEEASRLLSDSKYGLDALTAILVVAREAELLQDAWLYLAALCAWAQVETVALQHPVLHALPRSVRDAVVEPLRRIEFSDPEVDEAWKAHVESYRRRKQATREDFEIVDALNQLEISGTE